MLCFDSLAPRVRGNVCFFVEVRGPRHNPPPPAKLRAVFLKDVGEEAYSVGEFRWFEMGFRAESNVCGVWNTLRLQQPLCIQRDSRIIIPIYIYIYMYACV